MQKNYLKLYLILLITIFVSCNESDTKKQEVANVPAAKPKIQIDKKWVGAWNTLIGETEGTQMRDLYKQMYIRDNTTDGKKLTDSVWIDANVIVAFADLFENQPSFDGVRFMNVVDNVGDPTTLLLIPTKADSSEQDTTKSFHKNYWSNIPINSQHQFKYFGTTQKIGETMKGEFDKYYRTNTSLPNTYCLSTSIWIEKNVIFALRDLIADDSNNVDGVAVLCAAYLDFIHNVPSQTKQNQTTILIIPTVDHKGNWNIVEERFDFDKTKLAAYNHGELCPDKCL